MKQTRKRKKRGGSKDYSLDNGGFWKVYLPPYDNMRLVIEQTKIMANYLLKQMDKSNIIFNAKFDKTRIQQILDAVSVAKLDQERVKNNFMEIQLMYCVYFITGKTRSTNAFVLGNMASRFI